MLHALRLSLLSHCCRDSCVLVLESGYCVGSLLAIVLHLILPEEEDKILEKCEVTPNGRLYDPSVHNTVTKVHPGAQ